MPPRDAPEVVIKNLVRDDWDGTFDGALATPVTPDIHHGWVDMESTLYEVTVSDPEEGNVMGGTTGFSGFDPTGAGANRKVDGTVNVNVWARRGWQDSNGNSIDNPRKAAYYFKWEVEDIVKNHWDATTAAGNNTDLWYLVPRGATRIPDTDEEPVVWRWQVTVGYGYPDNQN